LVSTLWRKKTWWSNEIHEKRKQTTKQNTNENNEHQPILFKGIYQEKWWLSSAIFVDPEVYKTLVNFHLKAFCILKQTTIFFLGSTLNLAQFHCSHLDLTNFLPKKRPSLRRFKKNTNRAPRSQLVLNGQERNGKKHKRTKKHRCPLQGEMSMPLE